MSMKSTTMISRILLVFSFVGIVHSKNQYVSNLRGNVNDLRDLTEGFNLTSKESIQRQLLFEVDFTNKQADEASREKILEGLSNSYCTDPQAVAELERHDDEVCVCFLSFPNPQTSQSGLFGIFFALMF